MSTRFYRRDPLALTRATEEMPVKKFTHYLNLITALFGTITAFFKAIAALIGVLIATGGLLLVILKIFPLLPLL